MALPSNCFYHGYLSGDPLTSSVALSLCDGLEGLIHLELEKMDIYISPVDGQATEVEQKGYPHKLRICSNMNDTLEFLKARDLSGKNNKHRTQTSDDTPSKLLHSNDHVKYIRSRRAAPRSSKFLEVLLVADKQSVDFIGKEKARIYYLSLMNIANAVYHHHTLGVDIEVVTVKIMYMDEKSGRNVISVTSPQRTVEQFCQWASKTSYYGGGTQYDVAVLVSRRDYGPAGYAPITGMCNPIRSCALVKDDGFTSAFAIAHEIGHVFGLHHDGQGNRCYGRQYERSVMATMVQSSFNDFWWSECSRQRMSEVIDSLPCLNNNPFQTKIDDEVKKPVGLSFSLDEQCRQEFGDNYIFCPTFSRTPCGILWCGEKRRPNYCRTKNGVPLNGTQCGESKHWWCANERCKYHGNEKPVDGGWGAWSGWGNCSLECDVGFKRRTRKCDNPRPQYGGKSCSGDGEELDTCKSEDCSEYSDSRAMQCSVMDVLQIRRGLNTWLPYQVDKVSDRCNLTCRSKETGEVATFDRYVEDGTPCSYDEPDDICLNGACIKVGCDGVRNSGKKADRCGICGGDGSSCKVMEGIFSRKFEYSAAGNHYEQMLVLPKGSRDIQLSETFTSSHNLALLDPVYYSYVLNGDGKQAQTKNFAFGGAWFQYINNGGHERLTAKGPLRNELYVMINPVDLTQKASVNYRYSVRKDDFTLEKTKYLWKFETWSECSVTCGKGEQTIVYGCYDKGTGEKLKDDQCRYIDRGASDTAVCERIPCEYLRYNWALSLNWSECSAICGDDGTQYQLFTCEETLGEIIKKVDDNYCTFFPEPVVIRPCNRKPCSNVPPEYFEVNEWGPCSKTCGSGGVQSRVIRCGIEDPPGKVNYVNDSFCAGLTQPITEKQPCSIQQCGEAEYSWQATNQWGLCSEECGETGVQNEILKCVAVYKGNKVESVEEHACSHVQRPTYSRPCNRKPCLKLSWEPIDEWSECSASCGMEGVNFRLVVCKMKLTVTDSKIVTDKFCEKLTKPKEVRPCNRTSCIKYNWLITSEWTDCTSTCGTEGTQFRKFICVAADSRKNVSDTNCAGLEKTEESRPCNRIPCYHYEWSKSDKWSPCSHSCGEDGIQTRNVFCTKRSANGNEVDDGLNVSITLCDSVSKPSNTQVCNRFSCQGYEWRLTNKWSSCSETCGSSAMQEQGLQCTQLMGNNQTKAVDESLCENIIFPGERPRRKCILRPCVGYSWKFGNWSQCSSSCDNGTQTREVKCIVNYPDGRSGAVRKEYCHNLENPESNRTCRIVECPSMVMQEWTVGPWSEGMKAVTFAKTRQLFVDLPPTNAANNIDCTRHHAAPRAGS
ncbi:hypothetical protein ACJMK2_033966 [Sinanodonta woodiana]|uniref:Peptidase M12B domain-containing protein n=1 Tax=Sinanodonta woodiana TaxID=1069815 RepID=A0ABD3WUB1_SINWO